MFCFVGSVCVLGFCCLWWCCVFCVLLGLRPSELSWRARHGRKKKGLNFKNPSHLGLGSENPSHLGEVLIRHVLPFSWVGFFLLSERHFFGIA